MPGTKRSRAIKTFRQRKISQRKRRMVLKMRAGQHFLVAAAGPGKRLGGCGATSSSWDDASSANTFYCDWPWLLDSAVVPWLRILRWPLKVHSAPKKSSWQTSLHTRKQENDRGRDVRRWTSMQTKMWKLRAAGGRSSEPNWINSFVSDKPDSRAPFDLGFAFRLSQLVSALQRTENKQERKNSNFHHFINDSVATGIGCECACAEMSEYLAIFSFSTINLRNREYGRETKPLPPIHAARNSSQTPSFQNPQTSSRSRNQFSRYCVFTERSEDLCRNGESALATKRHELNVKNPHAQCTRLRWQRTITV